MRIRHWIAWGLLVFVILTIGGTAFTFHAAGYEKYIVQTGSMVPELDPGDLVIDRPAKDGYRVGDVVTFRHGQGDDLVTHRIIAITDQGIKTKGDANRTADVWTIPPDYVQGVVAFHIPKGGYVIAFLSKPAGIGAVTVGIIGLILLWRLFFPSEAPDQAGPEPGQACPGCEPEVNEPGTGRHHADAAGDSEGVRVESTRVDSIVENETAGAPPTSSP